MPFLITDVILVAKGVCNCIQVYECVHGIDTHLNKAKYHFNHDSQFQIPVDLI